MKMMMMMTNLVKTLILRFKLLIQSLRFMSCITGTRPDTSILIMMVLEIIMMNMIYKMALLIEIDES